MRKLLILTTTFPRWENDSEAKFVFNLARELAKDNDVHILAPYHKGAAKEEVKDKINIHRFRYWFKESLAYEAGMWPKFKKSWKYKIQVLPFLVSMFFSMRKIIKGENIDVVSSFYLLPCGLLASLNNKISNVPFINTGMGTDVELVSKHKWLKNFIMKKANTNIVLSNDLKNKLGDVKVIPIGLYLDKFEFKPKEKTGITSLLCVGRLNEQKGFQYAIEAVKILIGREQRVYLNIVGEGDYRPQLQALID